MAEIRDGTLAEIVRRRLLAPGQDPLLGDVSNELVAAIILENDRPEWKFLSGERLAMGVAAIAAVALDIPQAQLFNPVNSGVLCVVEGINTQIEGSGPAQPPFLSYYDAALGSGAAATVSRDRRWDGPAGGNFRAPMVQVRELSSGTRFGTLFGFLEMTGISAAAGLEATYWRWPYPIILGPSTGITVAPSVINRTTRTTFIWRERQLTAWEAPNT